MEFMRQRGSVMPGENVTKLRFVGGKGDTEALEAEVSSILSELTDPVSEAAKSAIDAGLNPNGLVLSDDPVLLGFVAHDGSEGLSPDGWLPDRISVGVLTRVSRRSWGTGRGGGP